MDRAKLCDDLDALVFSWQMEGSVVRLMKREGFGESRSELVAGETNLQSRNTY